MNKKYLLLAFVFSLIFIPKDTYALTSSEYSNRHVCPKFELAGAHTDGSAVTVGCYNSYNEAKNAMKSNGASDLFIFDETGTKTNIIDAVYAIADLGGTATVYLYESSALNTRIYTSVNTTSYGSDSAFIEVNPSNFAAKIKIAGFTGWVAKSNYTIIPVNWIKRNTNYTVASNKITHNYCANPATSTGYSAVTIGPKPDMLNNGTYYSYDGHYFYTDMISMLKDYKNNTNSNAYNKNPYYNYYMYLSNHTKTTYSSLNIDEYTKNVLGVKYDEYSDVDKDSASRLYGKGAYFYNTQQIYGINAVLSYSLSRNETANGTSNLAINKNNGFGLNAVDSSPGESATYYATFASSIYGYASKWNSYGFSYATDWRYFGPAFGDKQNGMNVKYATDAYWSEKMASKYYQLDSYYGLNDYNYYQLGIVTKPTKAYFNTNASKVIYDYPESGDQLVIVGESGNYYKVMSDMNMDSNGNLIGSKDDYTKPYNWNTSYVYVLKSDVLKINNGKYGYVDPNSVTNYKDSKYTYDLYVENTVLKPKVAKLIKDTNYYYDSSLTSQTGKKVLKDKWVMVYTAAYNENGEVVSYLITSDYLYDQKHWVDASTLQFITTGYGKQIVNISGVYEWVLSEPIDNKKYLIGGQYTNSYVPLITSQSDSSGNLWYKVPVSLDSNTNSYGWILASEANAHIEFAMFYTSNNSPVIIANDKQIIQGTNFDATSGVKATDQEDGDITKKIKVTSNNVNINVVGTYKVTYSVTDSDNKTTTKTINVSVVKDEVPVIDASSKTIALNSNFNELSGVKATDKEDGDITNKIKVIENTVNTKLLGNYKVTYQVTDSYGNKVTKTIDIKVAEVILEEKKGRFDLEYLKNSSNKLMISGYSTIDGINNDLNTNITYKIIFENIDNGKIYTQELNRITDNSKIPYNVPSPDGKNYKYSWFNGEILVDNIPNGDYRMYIEATNDRYYSKTVVSNQLFSEQIKTFNTSSKYVLTRNNYFSSNRNLELVIREEKLFDKTTDALSNQYGQYEELSFKDNKLYIYGNSFSIGMDLSMAAKVTRKIIFENTSTYKTYNYNLSNATKKLYQVKLPVSDNFSKDNAWYEGTIDISNLEVGEYVIYISTSSNLKDIGELNEQLFRDLGSIKTIINNKEYKFKVNYDKRYRVELEVKKK